MQSGAEIYCYLDPGFSKDLKGILDTLKVRGFRILVGDDLEELILLMQLSDPAAIIYTLSSFKDVLSDPFQTISKEAKTKSVPIVLIGLDEGLKQFKLFVPKGSIFDEQTHPMERLTDVLEAQISEPVLLELKSVQPKHDVLQKAEMSAANTEQIAQSQGLGTDEAQVSVSSALKASSNDTSIEDPSLPKKPRRYGASLRRWVLDAGWIKITETFSLIAAVVCIGLILYLSTITSAPVSESAKKLERNVFLEKRGSGQVGASLPKAVPTSVASASINESNAVPFPAAFRIGKSVFLFREEWEERRFVNLITGLQPDTTIHVIGHATEGETQEGKGYLRWSRAWSVYWYLIRNGVKKERIKVFYGKPVIEAADLDQSGRPRNRFVDIILE